MISTLGKDFEDSVRLTAEAMGLPEDAVREVVAVEMGLWTSDVVVVDDDGEPLPPDRQPGYVAPDRG